MNQKSIRIAAVLAATMLTALFTTMPPFTMKDAEGQSFPPCPPGYERNVFGIVYP